MYGLGIWGANLFDKHWRGMLSDYVTAVTWSPDGTTLAASSALGEVILWQGLDRAVTLAVGADRSIDCLAFSQDGQMLAAGGQDGQVKIWHLPAGELVATFDHSPTWIDKLAWSPTENYLAYSSGRYIQVWDGAHSSIVATLNFEASSVFDIAWHPEGNILAVGGYQGARIWNTQDWHEDPYTLKIPTTSLTIGWSSDGKYLASGNFDRTIAVLEWHNPDPWAMRGFPGKVRKLAWSDAATSSGAPLLAACSAQGIAVWEKHLDSSLGWQGRELEGHEGVVQAIAFQPGTSLLASAAEDSFVCLWQEATQVAQILDGAESGFSCLAWHPHGHQLAAGGNNGELLIWSKTTLN